MADNLREFFALMRPAEWLALVLTIAGSLAIWGLALWFPLARFRRSRRPPTGFGRYLPAAVWLAAAAYGALFLYARFVEPDELYVRRLRFESPKLPCGETLRLLHLTDIHARRGREEQLARAADAAAALRPDLLVLTGDYLCDYTRGAPTALLVFLFHLPDVPAYAVTGNYGGRYVPDPFLETLGIETLHTETRLLTIRGMPLELHGASPTRAAVAVRPRVHPEWFGIFLEHFPALFPQAAAAGWDLFLAGHTHGGQVRLPGYGALITLDRRGKEFEWGAYRLGDSVGYVSAGLGMECTGLPQVRFLCPPEIALIEVTGTGYSPR